MCLIAFAIDVHPDYPLILIANRDEFYNRPTEAAHLWKDQETVFGGRDIQAGGTWMAVSEERRFAAVTNYRDLKNIREDVRSRGELPVDFLNGADPSWDYMKKINEKASEYNGFNLLTYSSGTMFHYSNYEGKINALSPGIYGLSNALLDTSWPKVTQLKKGFEKEIGSAFTHESLLTLLMDSSLAEDANLPDTGVGYDLEKMLSAICIKSEKYGTCCSTILTIHKNGEVKFTERSYPVGDRDAGDVSFTFQS